MLNALEHAVERGFLVAHGMTKESPEYYAVASSRLGAKVGAISLLYFST